MLHFTMIPYHCIQVDIERLLFSLAVKLHNFLGPNIDKKVINWPISHSARHQRPARERHKIRIASQENVDNQTPRNTNFTH